VIRRENPRPALSKERRNKGGAPDRYNATIDDAITQSVGMAGLCGVLDDSLFLVSGAPLGRSLAIAEAVAVSGAVAGLGCDVGSDGAGHRAMAAGGVVCERMDLGSGAASVWDRIVVVFAIEQEFQRAATGRPSGSDLRARRAAVSDDGDSDSGAASGVSGASL